VLTLRSAAEEYDAIARVLRERHVHDGVSWSGCAVIAHDTRQVAALDAGATHVTFADAKGNSYIVPTAGLAYIELGSEESRRVGFVA